MIRLGLYPDGSMEILKMTRQGREKRTSHTHQRFGFQIYSIDLKRKLKVCEVNSEAKGEATLRGSPGLPRETRV